MTESHPEDARPVASESKPDVNEAATPTQPVATPPARKPARKGWVTPALGAIAAIAIGLVGGILIGQHTGSSSQAFGPRGGQIAQQGGGAEFTSGTIVSVKDGTLVVKTRDGSEKKVAVGVDTTVTKTSDASLDDLANGDTVTVVGRTGSDGELTATSIAEGDAGFGGIRRAPARAN